MVSGLASRDGISVRHGDGGIIYHSGVFVAKITMPNELFGAGRSEQEYFARELWSKTDETVRDPVSVMRIWSCD